MLCAAIGNISFNPHNNPLVYYRHLYFTDEETKAAKIKVLALEQGGGAGTVTQVQLPSKLMFFPNYSLIYRMRQV